MTGGSRTGSPTPGEGTYPSWRYLTPIDPMSRRRLSDRQTAPGPSPPGGVRFAWPNHDPIGCTGVIAAGKGGAPMSITARRRL